MSSNAKQLLRAEAKDFTMLIPQLYNIHSLQAGTLLCYLFIPPNFVLSILQDVTYAFISLPLPSVRFKCYVCSFLFGSAMDFR